MKMLNNFYFIFCDGEKATSHQLYVICQR